MKNLLICLLIVFVRLPSEAQVNTTKDQWLLVTNTAFKFVLTVPGDWGSWTTKGEREKLCYAVNESGLGSWDVTVSVGPVLPRSIAWPEYEKRMGLKESRDYLMAGIQKKFNSVLWHGSSTGRFGTNQALFHTFDGELKGDSDHPRMRFIQGSCPSLSGTEIIYITCRSPVGEFSDAEKAFKAIFQRFLFK